MKGEKLTDCLEEKYLNAARRRLFEGASSVDAPHYTTSFGRGNLRPQQSPRIDGDKSSMSLSG